MISLHVSHKTIKMSAIKISRFLGNRSRKIYFLCLCRKDLVKTPNSRFTSVFVMALCFLFLIKCTYADTVDFLVAIKCSTVQSKIRLYFCVNMKVHLCNT